MPTHSITEPAISRKEFLQLISIEYLMVLSKLAFPLLLRIGMSLIILANWKRRVSVNTELTKVARDKLVGHSKYA